MVMESTESEFCPMNVENQPTPLITPNDPPASSPSAQVSVGRWEVEWDKQGYQKLVCNGEDVTEEIGHVSHTDLCPIKDAHNGSLARATEQLQARIQKMHDEHKELVDVWSETSDILGVAPSDDYPRGLIDKAKALRAQVEQLQARIKTLEKQILGEKEAE
jgi:hypothetical protein